MWVGNMIFLMAVVFGGFAWCIYRTMKADVK